MKTILNIKRSKNGLGIFVSENIKKGSYLTYYKGKKITNKQAEKHKGRYLYELNNKSIIDGAQRDNVARYFNHSCKNNVEAIVTNRIRFYTIRDIKKGEELTIDYGKDYLDEFIPVCKCDSCYKKFSTGK